MRPAGDLLAPRAYPGPGGSGLLPSARWPAPQESVGVWPPREVTSGESEGGRRIVPYNEPGFEGNGTIDSNRLIGVEEHSQGESRWEARRLPGERPIDTIMAKGPFLSSPPFSTL